MKNKKVMAFVLLTVTTLLSYQAELSAWARKPMDTARCQRDRKTMERCRKENDDDNEYNFTALLSPSVYAVYGDFTPQQKKAAMDYADGNKMEPNDAVMRVSKQARR